MNKNAFLVVTLVLSTIALFFSSCSTSWKNPDVINSSQLAGFDNSTKKAVDAIVEEVRKSRVQDSSDNFWDAYTYQLSELSSIVHELKYPETGEKILSDTEISKVTEALIDYYEIKIDETYKKYDEHFIPIDHPDFKVEYLSNNRFGDVNVRIYYSVKEEPIFISDPEGDFRDHLIGIREYGAPNYIDNSISYKRYIVLINKPGANIPDATYQFETTLPGRDYNENVNDENESDFYLVYKLIVDRPILYEAGDFMDPKSGWSSSDKKKYKDVYHPAYVRISANGKDIEVDDK